MCAGMLKVDFKILTISVPTCTKDFAINHYTTMYQIVAKNALF